MGRHLLAVLEVADRQSDEFVEGVRSRRGVLHESADQVPQDDRGLAVQRHHVVRVGDAVPVDALDDLGAVEVEHVLVAGFPEAGLGTEMVLDERGRTTCQVGDRADAGGVPLTREGLEGSVANPGTSVQVTRVHVHNCECTSDQYPVQLYRGGLLYSPHPRPICRIGPCLTRGSVASLL